MIWDVPHHRGMGFPLTILRPATVYPIMSILHQDSCLRPSDMTALSAAGATDDPLAELWTLPEDISDSLGRIRSSGLIRRCIGDARGAHTRYHLTGLGTKMIEALSPLTAWALGDPDFVVAATRVRLDLPPLSGPLPDALRTERAATAMAITLLSGQWSDTVMVYVDSAGEGGIGPQRLQMVVNTAIDASAGESRVERHLHRGTLHRTLNRLVAKGLLEHREDAHAWPPWVRYRLSEHGRGLMGAWWQVAEDFGIPHDAELFRIMARLTNWFPDAQA